MFLHLALALALAAPNTQPMKKIAKNTSVKKPPAAFEAFPASGAGTFGACPLPNWALYSEQFNSWPTGASVVAAPTVTADQAANPIDGAVTADRAQIPATTSGSGSWVYPGSGTLASVLGGPTTCSVYVKGNGTSGTIDLCADSPITCSACSYVSGSWTLCSLTATLTSGGNYYIGNMSQPTYNGGVSRSAQDVFLWGNQCNVGSSRSTYSKTVTALTAPQPTGTRGEALTFTRTGTATCTKTASGGLATTGIADGDLVLYPANMARVEFDSAGTLGLLVESSRTNSVIRSQEINDAAWTKGAAVGTITPNYANGPDGTLTADRYQYSNTNADYVLQTWSVGGLAAAAPFTCAEAAASASALPAPTRPRRGVAAGMRRR